MTTSEHRDDRLVALLRERGAVSVADIGLELGVGTATVRRDLERLARAGRLVRTYGGATLATRAPAHREASEAMTAKRLIGAAAAELVRDGQTIAISSGSTTLELARRLVDRRALTVITNALDVAEVLIDAPGIELIVLGGVVRPRMHSLLGHLAELSANELRADALYMGIPAISLEHGLMSDHMPEILTDRAMRRMTRDVVVLADARKFERVAPAFVFGLEEVATIVTDADVAPAIREALGARGIHVIVAGDSSPDTLRVADAVGAGKG
ncbi:MAG TPA: DeoR/GlpR family DNA-binding transcription regulator [Candidatus Limnocylindrales bacterium]|jgi:DeoR/GlpR family transcriptional regulator of sugar metabolism